LSRKKCNTFAITLLSRLSLAGWCINVFLASLA
jgi:hypothetical protein